MNKLLAPIQRNSKVHKYFPINIKLTQFIRTLYVVKQSVCVSTWECRLTVCRARKDTYFRTESEDVSIVQKMQFDDRFLAKDRKLNLRTIGSNRKIPPKFQSKKNREMH